MDTFFLFYAIRMNTIVFVEVLYEKLNFIKMNTVKSAVIYWNGVQYNSTVDS